MLRNDLMPVTTGEHGLACVYARILNRKQATRELRRARMALVGARRIAERMGTRECDVQSVVQAKSRVRTWIAAVEMLVGDRA